MVTTASQRSSSASTRAARKQERAEERRLFARWLEHGDQRARQELVERFLPLVHKLARRYASREPFDDLIQVASVGLLKAMDRFDPERGTAFSSFAVPTILGEIKRYFRDCGWFVHVPRGTQELALAVAAARQELVSRTGHEPSINELAERLELRVEDVLDALEAAAGHHAGSLDAPTVQGSGEPATLADMLGEDDARFEVVDAGLTIAAAARQLPEQERRVLALRFGSELSQKQIAARIGVSQMQVSRVLRRTLDRMRETIEAPVAVTDKRSRPPRRAQANAPALAARPSSMRARAPRGPRRRPASGAGRTGSRTSPPSTRSTSPESRAMF
jgi:RNA polymerase sigma-B factor